MLYSNTIILYYNISFKYLSIPTSKREYNH